VEVLTKVAVPVAAYADVAGSRRKARGSRSAPRMDRRALFM
jgi:hypothetical protein